MSRACKLGVTLQVSSLQSCSDTTFSLRTSKSAAVIDVNAH